MADERPYHWIDESISDPDYLHRATGTPAGKTIAKSTIKKDEHSTNSHLRHAAQEAENLSHLNHHRGGKSK